MKKNIKLIISLLLSIFIGVWLYNYCTTPSNDLSEERIGNVGVKQQFNKQDKTYSKDPMIHLEGKTFYRSSKCKGLIIHKENKHNRITAVTLSKSSKLSTSRDITIGSSKEDVITAYGETFKKSILPKEQTVFHYKDKENRIGMKFMLHDNKVNKIELFEE